MGITIKELNKYITKEFNVVNISKPVFYNFPIAIRFELGNPEETSEYVYMQQVYNRAFTLFEEIFSENENFYILIHTNKGVNDKKTPKVFEKFLKNKKLKYNLSYNSLPYIYDEDDKDWETSQFLLKCTKKDLYYKQLLKAIANVDTDLSPKINFSHECYFINIEKGIIFHIYSDKGLDIVGKSTESIQKLYLNYNNWILDYDRNQIDRLFTT
ncbi:MULTISPECIES: DUF3885 domain-containing protein [Priestia]|uniref:DUF3885 domain-containing protein n=1 Tax=Priestia TaxID=2800373 RepID=UPI000652BECF|nr:DUF3885 domain-containing protein [Priestia aryabhattai]KMN92415.1 hypothetical protein ABV89_27435 [Priestia aryabhattai]